MPTSAVNPNTAQQVSHAVDVKSREDLVKLELQHRNKEAAANRQMQLLAMKEQAEQARLTREHQRNLQAEGAQQEKDRYAEYQEFLAGESEKQRTHDMDVIDKNMKAVEKRMAEDWEREKALTAFKLTADFQGAEAQRAFDQNALDSELEIYRRTVEFQTTIEDTIENKDEQMKSWGNTLRREFNKSLDRIKQVENMSDLTANSVDSILTRVIEGTFGGLVTDITPLLDIGSTFNEPVDRAGNKVNLSQIAGLLKESGTEVSPEAMEEAIRALNDPTSELYQKALEQGIPTPSGQQQFATRSGIDKESIRQGNRFVGTANMLSAILMEASQGSGDYTMVQNLAPLLSKLVEFEQLKSQGVSQETRDKFIEEFRANLDPGQAHTLHAFLTSVHMQMGEGLRDAATTGGDTSKLGRKNRRITDEALREVRGVLGGMVRVFEGMAGAGKMPSYEAIQAAPALLIDAYRQRDEAQLLKVAATLPDDLREVVVDMISEGLEEQEAFDLEEKDILRQMDELAETRFAGERQGLEIRGESSQEMLDKLLEQLDAIK